MYRRHLPDSAPLLRRALTWMLGVTLIQPQHETAMLMMDDPGAIQDQMYAWNHPSLSLAQIRAQMIAPLRRAGAVLTINLISGRVDRERGGMVAPNWDVKIDSDHFGHRQDNPQLKQGLEEGVAAGVFELQCHGWSHMVPDLHSPPGPWHAAPLEGEASENGWYAEFADRRRGAEVPAITQRRRLQRGMEALCRAFGREPLLFRVSGGKMSSSLEHHTPRVGVEAGFAVVLIVQEIYVPWQNGVIHLSAGAPLVLTCHDMDLFHQPDTIERMMDAARRKLGVEPRFSGFEAFAGAVHARITRRDDGGLAVCFAGPACRQLAEQPSRWQVAVADWYAAALGGEPLRVAVDGAGLGDVAAEPREITIAAGAGEHVVTLTAAPGTAQQGVPAHEPARHA